MSRMPERGAGGPSGARVVAGHAWRPAAMIAASADAIYTLTFDGVVTSWNPAAERLYGHPAAEAVGRPLPIVPPEGEAELAACLERARAGGSVTWRDTERVRRDGTRVCVSVAYAPLTDADGRPVEAVVIARDETDRRRAERHRRRLHTVTATLSEAVTPDEVVRVVLGEGLAAVEASAGAVGLIDDADEHIDVLGGVGYAPGVLERFRRIPLASPLPMSETVRRGEPVWMPHSGEIPERYPDLAAAMDLTEPHAIAAMPLVVRGRIRGAMGLRFPEPRDFPADERDFMLSLARQCAQALERARLYEVEQRAREAAELAQRRSEFLVRAGGLLGSSLDPEATLHQVARLAVPHISDWAAVDLLQEDGSIEQVAMAHADPGKMRWARALAERYPRDPGQSHGTPAVIRTGEAVVVPEVTPEMIEAVGQDAEHRDLLLGIGMRSVMIVPLRARGRTLGAVSLISAESGRRFGDPDLRMARELADRCALAVDNARLFAERSFIARTLQRELLPPRLPDIPDIELAGRYRAAGRVNEVGGDFYDAFPAREGWTFVAGDVVGKGPVAARITGLARHTVRAAAMYERRPSDVLRVLNTAMLDQAPSGDFCTVVCAHLEGTTAGAELNVCCAGHPLPFVLRADGGVERAGRPGQPVGVIGDPVLEDAPARLGAGDTLVLYTDGVTEAKGATGFFGEDRLAALLAVCAGMPPAQLTDRLERAVAAYQEGPLRDDIAILAIRVRPHGAG